MKKIYNYTQGYFLLSMLFALLFFAGCKSKKVTLVESDGSLKAKSHNEVLDDVISHELNYETISTKGSVSVKGKKMTTVFKLMKDEVLQASVRIPIIGAEAMRIDITPAKIVLIDRLSGRYAEVDFGSSQLNDKVAFNFYNLQALLTNQLFVAGESRVTKKDYEKFKIKAVDNKYLLHTQDRNKIEYVFSVNPSERIISTYINSPAKGLALLWNYDRFVEDGPAIYPTDMEANLTIKDKKMAVGISYSKLEVNSDLNIDVSIPSKYKKVDVLDIIGEYMKLK